MCVWMRASDYTNLKLQSINTSRVYRFFYWCTNRALILIIHCMPKPRAEKYISSDLRGWKRNVQVF